MKLEDYVKRAKEEEAIYEYMSYPEDVKRIVEVLKEKDIEVNPNEAEDIWDLYSDDYCAQWLGLPSDDEKVFEIVIEYAKKKYGIEEK